jgi:hypothetical protein
MLDMVLHPSVLAKNLGDYYRRIIHGKKQDVAIGAKAKATQVLHAKAQVKGQSKAHAQAKAKPHAKAQAKSTALIERKAPPKHIRGKIRPRSQWDYALLVKQCNPSYSMITVHSAASSNTPWTTHMREAAEWAMEKGREYLGN